MAVTWDETFNFTIKYEQPKAPKAKIKAVYVDDKLVTKGSTIKIDKASFKVKAVVENNGTADGYIFCQLIVPSGVSVSGNDVQYKWVYRGGQATFEFDVTISKEGSYSFQIKAGHQ